MMNLRQNTLLKQTGASVHADWASGYTVTVYEIGAVATAGSAAAVFTVAEGHGFAASDKVLIDPGGDNTFSGSNVVQSVAATSVTMDGGAYSVVTGDKIVNLGPDTGTSSPNYDGSGITIYSDAVAASSVASSRVTCSSLGEYSYWHAPVAVWELVRDSGGTVVDLILNYDAPQAVAALPTAATHWLNVHVILIEADGSSEWVCLLDTDGTTPIWAQVA